MIEHPYGVFPGGPLWGVFTYSFIHVDLIHLMLNCAALITLWFMKPGSVFIKLLAMTVPPVIVGLIFREVMSGQTVMIGASVSVYALLGFYAAPPGVRWRLGALAVLVLEPFIHVTSAPWHVLGFLGGAAIYFATVATLMLTKDRG